MLDTIIQVYIAGVTLFMLWMAVRWNNTQFIDSIIKTLLYLIVIIGTYIELILLGVLIPVE